MINYTMGQINAVREQASLLDVNDWISGERAASFLNWYHTEKNDRSIKAQKKTASMVPQHDSH